MWLCPMKHTSRSMAANSRPSAPSLMSRGTTYSRTGSRGEPCANIATSSRSSASSSPRKSQYASARDGSRPISSRVHSIAARALGLKSSAVKSSASSWFPFRQSPGSSGSPSGPGSVGAATQRVITASRQARGAVTHHIAEADVPEDAARGGVRQADLQGRAIPVEIADDGGEGVRQDARRPRRGGRPDSCAERPRLRPRVRPNSIGSPPHRGNTAAEGPR